MCIFLSMFQEFVMSNTEWNNRKTLNTHRKRKLKTAEHCDKTYYDIINPSTEKQKWFPASAKNSFCQHELSL